MPNAKYHCSLAELKGCLFPEKIDTITLKCVTHCVLIILLTALHARAAAGNPDSEAATAETTVVELFPIKELFSF